MTQQYDLIVRGGRVFDGTGAPGILADVGVRDGHVVAIGEGLVGEADRVLDAAGKWVTPGFVDVHTHYDAEVLVAPGLGESVRHGVTTVVTGSCSISAVHVEPEDCADLFARVEALPHDYVLDALGQRKDWSSPEGWIRHLEGLPLGPNVASLIGHSDIRAHVMGLGRSVDEKERPSAEEMSRMEQLVGEAMAAGFVGLSTMTNPWDKLDGERFRSKSLPSTYATWREYGRLHDVVREAGRVLQSAPNLNTKVNLFGFFAASASWLFRKTMKTSLIAAADVKASEWLAPALGWFTRFVNKLVGADLRWQGLPVPFEVYADGIDLVVFEEFGAGQAAMHLADEVERNELLQSEAYRRAFRRDYEKRFTPRIWHRDLYDAWIVECPDDTCVGKTIGQVADERAIHPADAFLDLVVEHGRLFRWKTTIANHRPEVLARLMRDDAVQVGFSDSGAHLRNMAFYNFPLRLLRWVQDSANGPDPLMSVEQAVHEVTGKLAAWWGIDAGRVAVGARADLVVIDPDGLDEAVDAYAEAPLSGTGPDAGRAAMRMVRRNDRAVPAVVIGGRVAYESGTFASDFGQRRFGRFLRAA